MHYDLYAQTMDKQLRRDLKNIISTCFVSCCRDGIKTRISPSKRKKRSITYLFKSEGAYLTDLEAESPCHEKCVCLKDTRYLRVILHQSQDHPFPAARILQDHRSAGKQRARRIKGMFIMFLANQADEGGRHSCEFMNIFKQNRYFLNFTNEKKSIEMGIP